MANAITFKWPNATPTAPVGTLTVKGAVVNDGTATTLTITHNLGFTTAELAEGFPEVVIEPTTANFYTETPFVSSKTANTVVITSAGAAAAHYNITIRRPLSSDK
jgi:hypothetical protein